MPAEVEAAPALPLAGWADGRLSDLAHMTGSGAIAALDGASLLGERAALNRFHVPGRISAGGGCRLLRTADDRWLALTLAREDDRALLPALFGEEGIYADEAIALAVAAQYGEDLLAQGRMLGLAVALADECPSSPAVEILTTGSVRERTPGQRPLVIDLSAIWAGPLAGHLFHLSGAEVVKVESSTRPDRMRDGDAPLFALINQGKASVSVDLHDPADRDALIALIRRADIVIEAARPRALLQLGIDADDLVRGTPGLVWLTLTGHGARGEAANWIGLGDDTGVAGGLTQARLEESGSVGFVGDAAGDPLGGIMAAAEGWRVWREGRGCRIGLSMAAIVARALADTKAVDPDRLRDDLRLFASMEGQPFAAPLVRQPDAAVRPFGADNAKWLTA